MVSTIPWVDGSCACLSGPLLLALWVLLVLVLQDRRVALLFSLDLEVVPPVPVPGAVSRAPGSDTFPVYWFFWGGRGVGGLCP